MKYSYTRGLVDTKRRSTRGLYLLKYPDTRRLVTYELNHLPGKKVVYCLILDFSIITIQLIDRLFPNKEVNFL